MLTDIEKKEIKDTITDFGWSVTEMTDDDIMLFMDAQIPVKYIIRSDAYDYVHRLSNRKDE